MGNENSVLVFTLLKVLGFAKVRVGHSRLVPDTDPPEVIKTQLSIISPDIT